MSEREGDSVRKELLRTIDRLSARYPALRICQLIGNAVPSEEAQRRGNDLYYVEDSQLLQWLLDYERKVESMRAQEQRD